MIIDVHAHLVTPLSILGIRTALEVSGGQLSLEWIKQNHLNMDDLDRAVEKNIQIMDKVGTDIQCLSPRPFTLMHSHDKFEDIEAWVKLQNDIIYNNIQRYPDRFRGIAALPQCASRPIEVVFDEIDRCINEMGFIGVMVNPDPSEGKATVPPLGDDYWTPLWEKLNTMDVPALIHSASCCNGRETYDEHFASEESLAITSLAHTDVFTRFPNLKLIIAHGGGAIPYQIGRWRSHWCMKQASEKPHIAAYFKQLEAAAEMGRELPKPPADFEEFDDVLKRFYFDTILHDSDALQHLVKKVGIDRCLFGTERPGSGGGINPHTGKPLDDFKFTIDNIEAFSDEDRKALYEDNARKLFSRIGLD